VGRYLTAAETEEVIVPRVAQMVIPLGQYYSGSAPIEPLEINREIQPLEEIAQGRSGLWLLYWNVNAYAHLFASSPPFDLDAESMPAVRRWLDGEGPTIVSREEFPGLTIFHFSFDEERG
jgi:hypothetical protein